MNSPHDIITKNIDLISLPEIVIKLNQMVDDPRCSTNDIASVLMQDPALSAHLLRIANSAYYNLPNQIDSVSLAVSIVGTRPLHDMILATSVVNHFQAIPDNIVSIQSFWEHNIACATTCSVIAARINTKHKERFFLSGLLHDIGKLVMYLTEPEKSIQVIEQSINQTNIPTLEKKIFGYDHCTLGAELLRYWRFPESLIEPVMYHHTPRNSHQYRLETACVHLSNFIANSIKPAVSIDDKTPLATEVCQYLNINESEIDTIRHDTELQLSYFMEMIFYQHAA